MTRKFYIFVAAIIYGGTEVSTSEEYFIKEHQ